MLPAQPFVVALVEIEGTDQAPLEVLLEENTVGGCVVVIMCSWTTAVVVLVFSNFFVGVSVLYVIVVEEG